MRVCMRARVLLHPSLPACVFADGSTPGGCAALGAPPLPCHARTHAPPHPHHTTHTTPPASPPPSPPPQVGVDVPAATIIAVEHAERIGLAQLHQLRGRVGRGGRASTCYLLTDGASPDALSRLKVGGG